MRLRRFRFDILMNNESKPRSHHVCGFVAMICFAILLLVAILTGCASAPPPWYGGYLDGVADYYDQGTGGGQSIDQADRNAQISLVGFQQGIQIESLTEDQIQSFQKQRDELVVEVMTSRGLQRVSGKLPPGSYIADRWQDGRGGWWSFAVAEKPGKARQIQNLRDSRLGAARIRSLVPGWAQFSKGQKSKGWRILGSEGVGVVGFATSAILQKDYEDRRDRVHGIGQGAADDRQYYDDWVNRFYWGSVTFGTLAGVTYLYSLIDGITSVPPTYRLLLSGANVRPLQEGGAVLVFTCDIR